MKPQVGIAVLLALLGCARTPVGRAERIPKPSSVANQVWQDEPIAADAIVQDDEARDAGVPAITIVSASFGEWCGEAHGNQTEALAKLCNGRRRCDQDVRDIIKLIQPSGMQGQLLPCYQDYKVEWTCGDGGGLRELGTYMAQTDRFRLRLGCGPAKPDGRAPSRRPALSINQEPGTVNGRAVWPSGHGARGLRVTIGAQSVLTNPEGRFVFHHVPSTYDLTLADRDGRHVTVYAALTRRDPVVKHAASGTFYGTEPPYHATISGWFQADQELNLPYGVATAQWLSPSYYKEHWMAYPVPSQGCAYKIDMRWDGGPVLTGKLFALVGSGTSAPPWEKAYLATMPLTLLDGDAVNADLRLSPLPTGRIAGAVQIHKESPHPEHLQWTYAVPGSVRGLDLEVCLTDGAYRCELPDLSRLGGEYCLAIVPRNQEPRASRCGGAIGMEDFSIPPAPPPPQLIPRAATSAKGDLLAWTGPGRPLYRLTLGNCMLEACAVVYLAKTSFSWSAFQALAVPFRGDTIADVSVSALYPYATMDELATKGSLGEQASWQRVDSPVVEIARPDSLKDLSHSPSIRVLSLQDAAHLPVCAPTLQAQSLTDVQPTMLDDQVTVRGVLTLSQQTCPPEHQATYRGCCAIWTVADPEQKARSVHLLQDMEPWLASPSDCGAHPPRIEVMARGILRPRDIIPRVDYKNYLLDGASVCAIRPSAPAQ
jgi:hypothetical protein